MVTRITPWLPHSQHEPKVAMATLLWTDSDCWYVHYRGPLKPVPLMSPAPGSLICPLRSWNHWISFTPSQGLCVCDEHDDVEGCVCVRWAWRCRGLSVCVLAWRCRVEVQNGILFGVVPAVWSEKKRKTLWVREWNCVAVPPRAPTALPPAAVLQQEAVNITQWRPLDNATVFTVLISPLASHNSLGSRSSFPEFWWRRAFLFLSRCRLPPLAFPSLSLLLLSLSLSPHSSHSLSFLSPSVSLSTPTPCPPLSILRLVPTFLAFLRYQSPVWVMAACRLLGRRSFASQKM